LGSSDDRSVSQRAHAGTQKGDEVMKRMKTRR